MVNYRSCVLPQDSSLSEQCPRLARLVERILGSACNQFCLQSLPFLLVVQASLRWVPLEP
ncbi:hypothetical protein A2U01_0086569 [Trifolium medium]|uniref:Uncharacterized protein n=1 Tax=Trifolium medium TaxID=97028 RepID=A0A392TVW5_9FABA|nr:hypothetical protein [Trifolium medium]